MRVWREFGLPQWRLILAMAPFSVLVGLGATAQAWVVEPIVDKAFSPRDAFDVYQLAGLFGLIALLRGGSIYAQACLLYRIDSNIIASAQSRLFRSLMGMDPGQMQARPPATLLARFLYDAMLLREAMSRSLIVLAKDMVTVLGLTGVMFYQNWRMALIALLIIPLAAYPLSMFSRRMRTSLAPYAAGQ